MIFFLSLPGTECYECFTHISWEDCRSKMVAKDCEIADDRCIQGEMAFNNNNTIERIFFKTFTKEYECNFYERDGVRIPTCAEKQRRGFSVDCRVTCNNGVCSQMVSILLFFFSCERTETLFFWLQSRILNDYFAFIDRNSPVKRKVKVLNGSAMSRGISTPFLWLTPLCTGGSQQTKRSNSKKSMA